MPAFGSNFGAAAQTSLPAPLQQGKFYTQYCAGFSFLDEKAYADASAQQRGQTRVASDMYAAAQNQTFQQMETLLRQRLYAAQTMQNAQTTPTTGFNAITWLLSMPGNVFYRTGQSLQNSLQSFARANGVGTNAQRAMRPGEGFLWIPAMLAHTLANVLSYFFNRRTGDAVDKDALRQRDLEDFPVSDLFTRRPVESSGGTLLRQGKQ
ncbi:MAG: hypothetical protein VKJ06_07445 [Vampirovibrionales bacterium]|nr:hypothetical protein [Vampirovibrionales bacterium]